MKTVFVLLLLCISRLLLGQSPQIKVLEETIRALNNDSQYEVAIKKLTEFIESGDTDNYERYHAYKLKSYTYKRLFNYPEVHHNLDKALHYGEMTSFKDSVQAAITAERAFAYFDEQHYDRAKEQMNKLRANNYASLDLGDKAYIKMQEADFLTKEKKYDAAEKLLLEAEALMQQRAPRNTPVVYGNMIEFYNTVDDAQKVRAAFLKGIDAAREHGILKYSLYLYERMVVYARSKGLYDEMVMLQDSVNAIATKYNANLYSGKVSLLVADMERHKTRLEKEHKQKRTVLLLLLSGTLLGFVILLYKYVRTHKERNKLLQIRYNAMNEELSKVMKEMREKEVKEMPNLSSRQKEVLQLLKEGKTNKEIATTLYISENTVKFHVKTLYEKLNIEHRSQIRDL